MVPQVILTNYSHKITSWQKLSDEIIKNDKVSSVAPFVETQAMLQNGGLVNFNSSGS